MRKPMQLECLCPHCHVTTLVVKPVEIDLGQSISVRCQSCFTPFEIVVADGVNKKKNVIVVGD